MRLLISIIVGATPWRTLPSEIAGINKQVNGSRSFEGQHEEFWWEVEHVKPPAEGPQTTDLTKVPKDTWK